MRSDFSRTPSCISVLKRMLKCWYKCIPPLVLAVVASMPACSPKINLRSFVWKPARWCFILFLFLKQTYRYMFLWSEFTVPGLWRTHIANHMVYATQNWTSLPTAVSNLKIGIICVSEYGYQAAFSTFCHWFVPFLLILCASLVM